MAKRRACCCASSRWRMAKRRCSGLSGSRGGRRRQERPAAVARLVEQGRPGPPRTALLRGGGCNPNDRRPGWCGAGGVQRKGGGALEHAGRLMTRGSMGKATENVRNSLAQHHRQPALRGVERRRTLHRQGQQGTGGDGGEEHGGHGARRGQGVGHQRVPRRAIPAGNCRQIGGSGVSGALSRLNPVAADLDVETARIAVMRRHRPEEEAGRINFVDQRWQALHQRGMATFPRR